jgi:uncharacterized membrane protein (DUF2068 family)
VSTLSGLDPRTLARFSVGTCAYAALFVTEGVGLLWRKRWAEYLTIIATGSLLPLEVYELVRHVSLPKVVVVGLNVGVVWYLLRRLMTTSATPSS